MFSSSDIRSTGESLVAAADAIDSLPPYMVYIAGDYDEGKLYQDHLRSIIEKIETYRLSIFYDDDVLVLKELCEILPGLFARSCAESAQLVAAGRGSE